MHKKQNEYQIIYHEKKSISADNVKEIFSWIFYTILAVVVAYIVVSALGTKVNAVGNSMEPEIYSGQSVLINKVVYKVKSPERNDIIAFFPNGNANTHEYIKRIVAVPGETVQIKDGELYIDGLVQNIEDTEYDKMEDAGIASEQIKLGNDEYFVLGDNRNSSEDSRSANIGVVNIKNITGRVWYKYGGQIHNSGLVKK